MNIKEAAVLLGVASLAVVLTAEVAAQGRGRGGPANYSVAAETTVKGTSAGASGLHGGHCQLGGTL